MGWTFPWRPRSAATSTSMSTTRSPRRPMRAAQAFVAFWLRYDTIGRLLELGAARCHDVLIGGSTATPRAVEVRHQLLRRYVVRLQVGVAQQRKQRDSFRVSRRAAALACGLIAQ